MKLLDKLMVLNNLEIEAGENSFFVKLGGDFQCLTISNEAVQKIQKLNEYLDFTKKEFKETKVTPGAFGTKEERYKNAEDVYNLGNLKKKQLQIETEIKRVKVKALFNAAKALHDSFERLYNQTDKTTPKSFKTVPEQVKRTTSTAWGVHRKKMLELTAQEELILASTKEHIERIQSKGEGLTSDEITTALKVQLKLIKRQW